MLDSERVEWISPVGEASWSATTSPWNKLYKFSNVPTNIEGVAYCQH